LGGVLTVVGVTTGVLAGVTTAGTTVLSTGLTGWVVSCCEGGVLAADVVAAKLAKFKGINPAKPTPNIITFKSDT
jgi:hypothetical protein